MKRDWDLIRVILLRAEEAPYATLSSRQFAPTYSGPLVTEHFRLLEEAGLIEASIFDHESLGALDGTVLRLTWAGHDYLEAVRNETIWAKTKALVSEKLGSTSLDVIKAIATKLALTQLGLAGS